MDLDDGHATKLMSAQVQAATGPYGSALLPVHSMGNTGLRSVYLTTVSSKTVISSVDLRVASG